MTFWMKLLKREFDDKPIAGHRRNNLSGMLFDKSLQEAKGVIDYGLSNDISTAARLTHAGPDGKFGVELGAKSALESLLDYQKEVFRTPT
ncbi:MAG: hypothetical protein ACE5IR_00500 [bacterium]